MTNIKPIAVKEAEPKAQQLLTGIEKNLGSIPNIFATFAHSAAVLEAYLNFSGALAKGQLDPKIREQLALTVAGANNCDYCASAHTAIGAKAGVETEELASSLSGQSKDAKTQAVLTFSKLVIAKNGAVQGSDVEALRAAGLTEAEIVEVVASIGLNIFTNYFNHIAATEIDFPLVRAAQPALTK